MTLAQLPPIPEPSSFSAVGWVFVCLVALVLGMNAFDDFWQRRRGRPPNEELKGSGDLVEQRVSVLERMSREASDESGHIDAKIDDMARQLREESRREMVMLHEKINKVDREVCALTVGQKLQSQQLLNIDAKIQRFIERGNHDHA